MTRITLGLALGFVLSGSILWAFDNAEFTRRNQEIIQNQQQFERDRILRDLDVQRQQQAVRPGC